MKELICTIHLFDLHQYVLLNDGSEPPYKEIAITSLDSLAEVLPQMCDRHDIYNVHLFGNENYIDGLVQDINQYQLTNYSNKKINFEVN